MSKEKRTLALLSEYFEGLNIAYWLEAGTALGAYRDGMILPWDHDIDIAIWHDDLENLSQLNEFFKGKGYSVLVQKGLPFIDNIIQLKTLPDNDQYIDVDIYIYRKFDGYAMMRWLQRPEGVFANIQKLPLLYARSLLNAKSQKWVFARKIIPRQLRIIAFKIILRLHLATTYCRYHKFPVSFFENLKTIELYGMEFNISDNTEDYLVYRYGESWRNPDDKFNQSGKWKKSKARPILKMGLLGVPKVNEDLIL